MAASYEQLIDRRFWEHRAPAFHIADAGFLQPDGAVQAPDGLAAGLAGEGYAQLRGLALDADFYGMARVARALAADGLDPVFCFVYDEFWRPYFRLDALFRSILGATPSCRISGREHRSGAAGWAPHRDPRAACAAC